MARHSDSDLYAAYTTQFHWLLHEYKTHYMLCVLLLFMFYKMLYALIFRIKYLKTKAHRCKKKHTKKAKKNIATTTNQMNLHSVYFFPSSFWLLYLFGKWNITQLMFQTHLKSCQHHWNYVHAERQTILFWGIILLLIAYNSTFILLRQIYKHHIRSFYERLPDISAIDVRL